MSVFEFIATNGLKLEELPFRLKAGERFLDMVGLD